MGSINEEGSVVRQNVRGNFNGQMAGRDIVNTNSQMLWHESAQDLRVEKKRCKNKLMSNRLALLCWSIPSFLAIVLNVLFAASQLLKGINKQPTFFQDNIYLYAAILVVFAIALSAIGYAKKTRGKMIGFYRERLDIIDTILRDRS